MSLAIREAVSLLSTVLENPLVMQIKSGVKLHEEISFACILASEVKESGLFDLDSIFSLT